MVKEFKEYHILKVNDLMHSFDIGDIGYVIPTKYIIFSSFKNTNIDAAIDAVLKRDDIFHYDIFHNGGCFIASPGDICFAIKAVHNLVQIKTMLMQQLIAYLAAKGINAQMVDNDIIVDGKYKVCGVAWHKDLLFCSISINNVNIDLIHSICREPYSMNKIPMGLKQFNDSITADEFVDWLQTLQLKV